jgi:hypothetical protein
MRGPFSLLLLVCAVSCGCRKTASREDEFVYLRSVMPDSLLEYAHLDVGSKKGVAIVGEGESRHLGLHLIPGQSKVHGGIRAEVSVDYPFQPGDTVRYSWRFMVPKEFVSDAPKNRWWVVGQWHDQPNRIRGETWQNFPANSPPILLGIGELEGALAMGLTYGPGNQNLGSRSAGHVPLERGNWHSISVVIRWSQGTDGKASVFVDDPSKPALVAEGPNMNNDFQHYWKLGMYRHPDIATDNWIYIDDLEISKIATP